jgi:hypothetical protein
LAKQLKAELDEWLATESDAAKDRQNKAVKEE